jgi:hypothetical protein
MPTERLTSELLHSYGWPEGEVTTQALDAAQSLLGAGLGREAVLVWLDQVCAQPSAYLSDPTLGPLARAVLIRAFRAAACHAESYSTALAG